MNSIPSHSKSSAGTLGDASLLLQQHSNCAHHHDDFAVTTARQPSELLVHCRTYLFPRFLNPERAAHFVALAKARLAPSSLAFKKGDTADTTKYEHFTFVLPAWDPTQDYCLLEHSP